MFAQVQSHTSRDIGCTYCYPGNPVRRFQAKTRNKARVNCAEMMGTGLCSRLYTSTSPFVKLGVYNLYKKLNSLQMVPKPAVILILLCDC